MKYQTNDKDHPCHACFYYLSVHECNFFIQTKMNIVNGITKVKVEKTLPMGECAAWKARSILDIMRKKYENKIM